MIPRLRMVQVKLKALQHLLKSQAQWIRQPLGPQLQHKELPPGQLPDQEAEGPWVVLPFWERLQHRIFCIL
jgi:hypothetical protein